MSSLHQFNFQTFIQNLTVCNWVGCILVRWGQCFSGVKNIVGVLWWPHFESQRLESAYHYWLVLSLEFHMEGCCVQHG